jgi:uncharacterized glyoxalase superfamily protein PhnB
MKKRTGTPWLSAPEYGRSLPALAANLLVRDTARAVAFYTGVLGARLHYVDDDFAALDVGGAELMLHADHTYEAHPWQAELAAGARRGLGAELRLLGRDPDACEARARAAGARVLVPAADKPHGWRETIVEDPDGYAWAVGVAIDG